MTAGEIRAALSLLADDDGGVVRAIREKLFAMGREAVLRVLAATDPDHPARGILEGLLRRLEEPPLEALFKALALQADGEMDLEEGCFAIARFGDPSADVEACRDRLDEMAADLAPRASPGDHPVHVIRACNAYLFGDLAFRSGAVTDPQNSYLDRVLDRRIGIPISLCAVYLLLGSRLDLPLLGVGMPGRFILKYQDDRQEIFLDPSARGGLLTRRQCREIVTRMGYAFEEEHLEPAPVRFILIRMMNNLLRAYLALKDEGRARHLMTYLQMLQSP